jgi:hypothetical protein
LLTIDGERKDKAKKFVDEKKITLPVLLLLKEKTMDQYGVRGWIPQIFYIDAQGILVGKTTGVRDWAGENAWPCIKELFKLQ